MPEPAPRRPLPAGELPELARHGEPLEEIWIFGQPPLGRLLEFVDDTVLDAARLDRAALVEQWRAANDYYQQLERTEAGLVNRASHRALDAPLRPLAEQAAADPRFRLTFDALPTSFGMVELDRLIVSQLHVTRNWVEAIQARIGPAPDETSLFAACLPPAESDTPVQIQKVGSRRYVFRSRSTDLRFLEPALLRAAELGGLASSGTVAGMVGLPVGFSFNALNAVRVGKRLLLNNGYHRAVALRALGVTHAPCVIQTASRADELQLCARSRVADDPEFYFESARPPLLKDFFDPRLRRLLPIRERIRQIEVSFEIRDHLISE